MSKKKTTQNTNEYYNELVPVFLIKDNDRYKDEVVVTLNGYNYQIQRGKEVMVPRKVALILEEATKQNQHAQSLIDELVRK